MKQSVLSFVLAITSSLTQHVSLHDGPNCFNAVLVGMGLMNQIRYVDGAEYRYYLETFCEPRLKTSGPHEGDLVVFESAAGRHVRAEHAAIVLGKNLIFEKTSASGVARHVQIGLEKPGAYQMKHPSESPFFNGERGPFKIQAYKCKPRSVIRSEIKERNQTVEALMILNLQRRLDEKLKSAQIEPLDDLGDEVQRLADTLAKRTGTDAGDLYMLALAKSFSGALDYAIQETDGVFVTKLYDTSKILRQQSLNLANKIRQHTRDPYVLRIVRETSLSTSNE